MKQKSNSSIIGRALATVAGFDRVCRTLEQQVVLRGQAKCTFENYIQRIAQVSLHFNRPPEDVSTDELNEYLVSLAVSAVSPSRSAFKQFLRRFTMHILPRRFVKIRYFGILTSAYREQVGSLKTKPDIFQLTETREQRITRLTAYDNCKCPKCKTGTMQAIETLPPIRSPVDVFFSRTSNLNL